MQTFSASAGCAFLFATMFSGCSSTLDITPVRPPTGVQLATYYTEEFRPALQIGPGTTRSELKDVIIVGTQYVNDRCGEFFDAVIETNRLISVGESGFLSASNQVQTLMRLASQSALSIAKVAAAVEVTKVLLEQYKGHYAFAPHALELRDLVFQTLDASRDGLLIGVSNGEISSPVAAIAAIKNYGENCTLSKVYQLWNQAIAKAVRQGVKAIPVVDGAPNLPAPPLAEGAGPRGYRTRGSDDGGFVSTRRYGVR